MLLENRKLLDLIAMHLVEIETLTREDIEDLVNTGQLTWWEKKKAKMAQDANPEVTVDATVVEEDQNENK